MNATELAARIDHTALKPEITADDVIRLCREAVEHAFASACVNPTRVALAFSQLCDTPIPVCSVVGFPLGAGASSIKAAEAERAIADGAREIDMVLNIGALRDGEDGLVAEDLEQVKRATGSNVLKVIIEAALLSDDEIVRASRIAVDCGADYVKTSTGFSPAGGATVEHVRLIRGTIGTTALIKAAGGIRDVDTALAMLDAGADRLGASASVAIVEAMQRSVTA